MVERPSVTNQAERLATQLSVSSLPAGWRQSLQVLVHVLSDLKAAALCPSAFPSPLVLHGCEMAAGAPDVGYISVISESL